MKIKLIALSMILILFASGASLYAEAPLDTIKEGINRVLDIVKDKSLDRKEKVTRIEKVYASIFDEVELAKRSLGRNWTKLNPEQQKEFIDLFRQVLEKAYIDKILAYNNEKIVFGKQSEISGNLTEVKTLVLSESKKIPINYRLIQKNNVWKVYDVIIENVSLIQNYRSQFNSILAKNSPEQLLQTLRNRVKNQKK